MKSELRARFVQTREFTTKLCQPLAIEDYVVQAMPDASPTRWHLAHTTWFFETFVLGRWKAGYIPFSPDYQRLFNSYYNSVGEQFPRSRRGLLTRPTVAEVFAYRQSVDKHMTELLQSPGDEEMMRVVELGIQHEQQHQELILTDLKYLLSCNPLEPVYQSSEIISPVSEPAPASWSAHSGGIVMMGHEGSGFAFDNESPRHEVLLRPFEIQNQLVTAGEYLKFIEDGGYRRPELWLSLGWSTVREQQWEAPLYWSSHERGWSEFTLGGKRPVQLAAPVTHVSFFEADAYARWRGLRLPTEAEWERAAADTKIEGSFAESEHFHPVASSRQPNHPAQFFGEVWQWTQSPYTPYPGYAPPAGALGEYNGKFMCNQYVLRGGSCATPASHIRPTYRNFFPPDARWQFSGIRLARDVAG
ncbi:ergothioneine biosynthesis protein EgtB [soil metagenome]